MCPKSMVASCDTKTGHEVVDDSEECCLPFHWCEEGTDDTDDGYVDDESDVKPIHMFVPVLLGHGRVCDVWFSRIIVSITVGL